MGTFMRTEVQRGMSVRNVPNLPQWRTQAVSYTVVGGY